MNYREMTDQQINDAVAMARGNLIKSEGSLSLYAVDGDDLCTDFCNSWTDAGPIIQRHGISVSYIGKGHERGEWGADEPVHENYTYGGNPLRCAMIVFLMMQEGK